MSLAKIGDKYVATYEGQSNHGIRCGDIAEVIREMDNSKKPPDCWGVLWCPKMNQGWTFWGDSKSIFGWRLLKNAGD